MKTHLKHIDGIRGFAALVVLLHHAYLTLPDPLLAQLNRHWVGALLEWLHYGHFSVDLFIVLSGFCLMLPVIRQGGILKGGALNFFAKRARRILLPYYFALVLSLLLVYYFVGKPTGTHWDISIPVTSYGLVTHALLLQDLYSDTAPQINHSLWSIAIEWHIYFLFPALVLCWKRFGTARTGLIALTLSGIAAATFEQTASAGLWPTYYGLFVLGALAATVAYREGEVWATIRERTPWWLAFGALSFCVVAYCRRHDFDSVSNNFVYLDYVVGLAVFALLVGMSLPARGRDGDTVPHPVARFFATPMLAFTGTFAYSIYLIHAPLLQMAWQYVALPVGGHHALESFCLLVGVGAPLILGVSYLFFLAFERPFLTSRAKAADRIAQKRLEAQVVAPAPTA